jgi:hypothetical protein
MLRILPHGGIGFIALLDFRPPSPSGYFFRVSVNFANDDDQQAGGAVAKIVEAHTRELCIV